MAYGWFRLHCWIVLGSRRLSLRKMFAVRVDDDLPFPTQVDRLYVVVLAAPLADVRGVELVMLQEIRGAQMNQHRAAIVTHGDLHIFGIGEIDLAQVASEALVRVSGIQLAHQV